MSLTIQKATRESASAKIALVGPSGNGKTLSALFLADGMKGDGKIGFIDTENRSGALYADLEEGYFGADTPAVPPYDILHLEPPYTPDLYIAAIKEFVKAGGYSVLIIDSYSHAWRQALEKKDALDKRNAQAGMRNWAQVKNEVQQALDVILQAPMHVIACMRSKTEYAMTTNEKGRAQVEKMGLGPVQVPEVEYEFTTILYIDNAHQASVDMMGAGKDRTGIFRGFVDQLRPKHGKMITDWLSAGAPPEVHHNTVPQPVPDAVPQERPKPQATAAIPNDEGRTAFGYTPSKIPHGSAFTKKASEKQVQNAAILSEKASITEAESRRKVGWAVLHAFGVAHADHVDAERSFTLLNKGQAIMLLDWLNQADGVAVTAAQAKAEEIIAARSQEPEAKDGGEGEDPFADE